MPKEVRQVFGLALQEAQLGRKSPEAKPLTGFRGAGVLEVVESYDGNAYRAVYTVRFAEVVYVLHVFQKKSKQGGEVPREDMELIRSRLADAEADYQEWLRERGG